MSLALSFTKLSDDRHAFAYRREDGTGETIELESRSFLIHDLVHYAVESEAGLKGSFYGILGKIGGYEELTVSGGGALGGEVAITETVVGALQGALSRDDVDAEALLAGITDYLELMDHRPPRWLTPAFVAAVRERMRQLIGRWKATPFGETMELTFPDP